MEQFHHIDTLVTEHLITPDLDTPLTALGEEGTWGPVAATTEGPGEPASPRMRQMW